MAPDVDGVLGFGRNGGFLSALVEEGLVSEQVMALKLNENFEAHIGEYDSTLVEGGENGIAWLETTSEDEWVVALSAATFNEQPLFKHTTK